MTSIRQAMAARRNAEAARIADLPRVAAVDSAEAEFDAATDEAAADFADAVHAADGDSGRAGRRHRDCGGQLMADKITKFLVSAQALIERVSKLIPAVVGALAIVLGPDSESFKEIVAVLVALGVYAAPANRKTRKK